MVAKFLQEMVQRREASPGSPGKGSIPGKAPSQERLHPREAPAPGRAGQEGQEGAWWLQGLSSGWSTMEPQHGANPECLAQGFAPLAQGWAPRIATDELGFERQLPGENDSGMPLEKKKVI